MHRNETVWGKASRRRMNAENVARWWWQRSIGQLGLVGTSRLSSSAFLSRVVL